MNVLIASDTKNMTLVNDMIMVSLLILDFMKMTYWKMKLKYMSIHDYHHSIKREFF